MGFDPNRLAKVGLGNAQSVFRTGKHLFASELFESPAEEGGQPLEGLLALKEEFSSDSVGYLCLSTLIRELEVIQPDDTFKLLPLEGFAKELRDNFRKENRLTCQLASDIFWKTLEGSFQMGNKTQKVELTLDVKKVFARRYTLDGKPDNKRSVVVRIVDAKYC